MLLGSDKGKSAPPDRSRKRTRFDMMNQLKTGIILLISGWMVWGHADPLTGQTPMIGQGELSHAEQIRQTISGQKLMHEFDFEERDENFLDLPMYWRKYVPPTPADAQTIFAPESTPILSEEFRFFPHYSSGLLDQSHARSGEYAFKLVSEGGSVGFEYDRRRIRVKAGCDFQVTAFVHLENVRTTKARLSCAFTDRTGRIVPDSERFSKLVGISDQDESGWARLEVYMPGDFPEVQHLTLGVWLLQQEQWDRENMAAETTIYRRDVSAEAWFDDIRIFQLPRVVLQTPVLGNVFDGQDEAALEIEVEGISVSDYQVTLAVSDAEQKEISRESWLLTGMEGARRIRRFDLPRLSAGLYQARLDIHSGAMLVATRHLTFLQLAPHSSNEAGRGQGFGLDVTGENLGNWDTLLRLTELTGAKLLKYPVWRKSAHQAGSITTEESFDRKLLNLQKHHIEMVAAFTQIPDALAAKMQNQRRGLLDFFSEDPAIWRSTTAYVLAQYTRQINFWQIGPDVRLQDGAFWDPRMLSVLNTLRGEFQQLFNNTVLIVPLNGFFEIQPAQTGEPHIAVQLAAAVKPDEIPAYLENYRIEGFKKIWVNLEILEETFYDRESRLTDFALRVAYALQGRADAIFIPHPWTQRHSGAQDIIEPLESYIVFRTLADHLGGARCLGEFEPAPGIGAMIFDYDGEGCLFVWRRKGRSDEETAASFNLMLGDNLQQVDLWGNRVPLKAINRVTQVHMDDKPILLTNINTRLALLYSSIKLSPSIIEASIVRQQTMLSFKNTFGGPITGRFRLQLNQPQTADWQIEPATFMFALQPGQEFHQPLSLLFPRNELGGPKTLNALFQIDADQNYQFSARIPFDIRLADIDVDCFARRLNDRDLLVQQVVTNEGQEEINLNCFIDLPDRDHLERAISHLQPGMSVTKTFIIPNAVQWLGQALRVGIYDPKGTRRINYLIDVN